MRYIKALLLSVVILAGGLTIVQAQVSYNCPAATPAYTLENDTCIRWTPTNANITLGQVPQDIKVDAAGFIYIVNKSANSVSKLNPAGQHVTGSPFAVGASPHSVFVDAAGFIYVTNSGSNTVSKLDSNGNAVAGSPFAVGSEPRGLFVDRFGFIYVTNFAGNSVSKLNSSGSNVTGSPFAVGTGPSDVVVDEAGFVYVSNWGSNTVTKLDPNGNQVVGSPYAVGSNPTAITLDANGGIYTANWGSNSISKLTPSGAAVDNSPFSVGINPSDVVINAEGNILVPNFGSGSVSVMTGNGKVVYGAPFTIGTSPVAVALTSAGNLYVADTGASKISTLEYQEVAAQAVYDVEEDLTSANVVFQPNYFRAGQPVAVSLSNVRVDQTTLAPATSGINCKLLIGNQVLTGVINQQAGSCNFGSQTIIIDEEINPTSVVATAGGQSRVYQFVLRTTQDTTGKYIEMVPVPVGVSAQSLIDLNSSQNSTNTNSANSFTSGSFGDSGSTSMDVVILALAVVLIGAVIAGGAVFYYLNNVIKNRKKKLKDYKRNTLGSMKGKVSDNSDLHSPQHALENNEQRKVDIKPSKDKPGAVKAQVPDPLIQKPVPVPPEKLAKKDKPTKQSDTATKAKASGKDNVKADLPKEPTAKPKNEEGKVVLPPLPALPEKYQKEEDDDYPPPIKTLTIE